MENTEFSKSFYKIKDVAEFVGVPQSTLRFWETKFPKEIAPIRNAGNTRYYTPEMIENARMIKYLLHTRGMKIEVAIDEMHRNKKNVSKRMKILSQLTEVRNDLKEILFSLTKRRDFGDDL